MPACRSAWNVDVDDDVKDKIQVFKAEIKTAVVWCGVGGDGVSE